MFEVYAHIDGAENQMQTWEVCGSTETTRWQRAGMDYIEMEIFFRCGEALRKTTILSRLPSGRVQHKIVLMLYSRQTEITVTPRRLFGAHEKRRCER